MNLPIHLLVPCLLALPLAAAPVAITNHNMESAPAAAADGAITSTVATGWTFANITGSTSTYTFNPTTSTRYYNAAEFLDTGVSGGAAGTMAGPNFTGVFDSAATGSARIQQTLAATLAANTQYTLSVALGHRTIDSGAAATAAPVTLELLAGGVSLGTATVHPATGNWDDTGTLPDDVWADAALVVATAASPAQLGQAITVRFTKQSGGNYMDIDNVRLDAVATVTPPTVNLATGLVGYFPFEDGFANRAGVVDGTAQNGAVAGLANGIAGKAMELRSTGGSANEHMDVGIGYGGSASSTNLGTNFSISAWYNLDQPPSGSSTDRYFIYEGNSDFDASYGIQTAANSRVGQVFTNATAPNSVNIAGAGGAGWHHVLQTYTVNGANTEIRTWVDGVAQTMLTRATAGLSDTGINIGAARDSANTRGFDGKIDEVALWSRALDATEVAEVRTRGLAGSGLVNPPVIAGFAASAGTVLAGEDVTLTWNVTGATNITITPGIGTVAAAGSQAVALTSPTTFILSATAADGSSDQASVTVNVSKGPIRVYLLGGQSNMQGVGRKATLVPLGLAEIPEVLLYHSAGISSTGGANQLMTTRACGFDSISFGPEIGFADTLRDLRRGTPMCLIKHAVGGTSLQVKWNPGADNSDSAHFGVEYQTFVSTVAGGLAALRAAGYEPVIEGMLWQQGEQDSKEGLNTAGDGTATSADDYGTNLKHFIGRVREQFAADIAPTGLRFVLGQVTPYYPAGGTLQSAYPGRDKIRLAQLNADEDSGAPLAVANTGTVPTNDAEFPVHEQQIDGYRDDDEAHFNEPALLLLGRRMAHEMLRLAPQAYVDWSTANTLAGGPDDDDDADGMRNHQEFTFGSDPMDGGSRHLPTTGWTVTNGQDFLVVNVRRNLNALAATYQVLVSTDLSQWDETAVFLDSTLQGDGTAIVRYRLPWSADDPAHPAGFVRIATP